MAKSAVLKNVKAKPEVAFPEVTAELFLRGTKKGPLTVAKLKDMIGWEVVTDETQPYLFEDQCNPPNKVRLTKNAKNRDFVYDRALRYAQDRLNNSWADSSMGEGDDGLPRTINGESITRGRYGNITSGQHRIVGWVFADQIRERDSHRWEDKWPDPMTFEALVVNGISEDTAVVSTIDNVMTRTFTDVLSTDPEMFKSFKGPDGKMITFTKADRKKLCKMTESAIGFLWIRMEMDNSKKNTFAERHGYRTHSESRQFLDRHPGLKEMVRHIWQENLGGNISKFISPGYASALCYLMGVSSSNPDDYNKMELPSEKKLKKDNWEMAKKFWTELSKSAVPASGSALEALAKVQRSCPGTTKTSGFIYHQGEGAGSFTERVAYLCKAWEAYLNNGKVFESDLKLRYKAIDPQDKTQGYALVEKTSVKGIDLGDRSIPQDEVEAEEERENEAAVKRISLREKLMENRAKQKEKEGVRGNDKIERVKGEAKAPPKVKYDTNGKPPAPKIKSPMTKKGGKEEPRETILPLKSRKSRDEEE